MNLRDRRLELKLTQTEAARRAGCSQPHYASVENGSRNPSEALLSRIERVLGGSGNGKKERGEDEKMWHELWVERYGAR